MNMFEEAQALYGTIKMCGCSQGDPAAKLGLSQSYVANKLRLLKFSPYMQELILGAGLSERHARAILSLRDEGLQRVAVARVRNEKMNVAECEQLVEELALTLPPREGERVDGEARIHSLQNLLDLSMRSLEGAGLEVTKHTEEDSERIFISLCIRRVPV